MKYIVNDATRITTDITAEALTISLNTEDYKEYKDYTR